MSWDAAAFENDLLAALNELDFRRAGERVEQLVRHLATADQPYPTDRAHRILQALRRKRQFTSMRRAGDAFVQTGDTSAKTRRLHAQALIDEGNLSAALMVLDNLIQTIRDSPSDARELAEARGLVGRVHKQTYVNAGNASSERHREHLRRAVTAYLDVYTGDPARHGWHGINVVALVRRAHRDGVPTTGFPNPDDLARDILSQVESKFAEAAADTWDFAIAVEACVALEHLEEIDVWLGRYLAAPNADAFELGSTLRQFTEVWQLNVESDPGRRLLPPLRTRLLQQEGGRLDLSSRDLHPGPEPALRRTFEKVFGSDSYQTYSWYTTGLERCLIVARIGRDTSQGHGTGFLIRASDLSAAWGDEPVLLTNAHVVSDDPSVAAKYDCLHSSEAVISFEALGVSECSVAQLLWSSPPEALDATVLRLAPVAPVVDKLAGRYARLAAGLPVVNDHARVYVIGHPRGGGLSLSLQDNSLLDHQDPLIHYRTPTEGGSSGSPVFNRKWDLIGLHHAGGQDLHRLNGKDGTYPANEGIWLDAIVRAIAKSSATGGNSG